MKCEKLFSEIEKLNEQYMQVWDEFCSIESPTNFKAGVDKASEYIFDIAKSHGWEIDVMHHEKAGDASCITMNANAKGKPICLSGHVDTVHPVGMFGYPPIRYDDEKIYGPGVADCKGGIVAALLAMHALEKVGFDSRPIRLILQTDEEGSSVVSGKATVDYMCKKVHGSVGFINLEPSDVVLDACIQRKGIATYRFTVTGKEAHSSACAVRGANAIADAAHKIIELEKFKDAKGITCNCGVISGGTVANTVPGKCEFLANFRFTTKAQREEIERFVNDLASQVHVNGCTCEFTLISSRPAMERTEKNLAFLDTMNEIFEQNGLEKMNAGFRTGGSDAAYITECGVPCIDSLGTVGGLIHSINEFSYKDSLVERAKRLAAVVYCI